MTAASKSWSTGMKNFITNGRLPEWDGICFDWTTNYTINIHICQVILKDVLIFMQTMHKYRFKATRWNVKIGKDLLTKPMGECDVGFIQFRGIQERRGRGSRVTNSRAVSCQPHLLNTVHRHEVRLRHHSLKNLQRIILRVEPVLRGLLRENHRMWHECAGCTRPSLWSGS